MFFLSIFIFVGIRFTEGNKFEARLKRMFQFHVWKRQGGGGRKGREKGIFEGKAMFFVFFSFFFLPIADLYANSHK